jgi:hypothetical protein
MYTYIVTNSHQVFVVADADTKVTYTGAYQWKKKKKKKRKMEGEEFCGFFFSSFFLVFKSLPDFACCRVTSVFCQQQ